VAVTTCRQSEPEPKGPGNFYGIIDFELINHPQTILAYEMNGEPLSVEHGARIRLRWKPSSASRCSSGYAL
jgi:DMSO/TMAO reductase YedYZ molybdopterin-dependent catalytic subunit